MLERIAVTVCVVSALLLAVSFVLPLTEHTTVVKADGRPAGLLGQMFPDPDSERLTTYGYFWQDIDWVVPLIFFLPALLVALRSWGPRRFRGALTLAAPLIAVCLLVPLVAMVHFADFELFPGTGGERVYGGYVALGSLGAYLVGASILAIAALIQMNRQRARSRARTASLSTT